MSFVRSLMVCSIFGSGCILDFDRQGDAGGGAGGSGPSTSISSSSSVGTGGEPATGGSGPCGPGAECVPPAETGWQGPGFLVDGTGSACASGSLFTGGAALSSAQPTCICDYLGTGPPCPIPPVSYFGGGSCSTLQKTIPVPIGGCSNLTLGAALSGVDGSATTLTNAGSCSAQAFPLPAFDTPLSVCATEKGDACDGGVCSSAPPASRACVWSSNAIGCASAGPYSGEVPFTVATGACTCGSPQFDCSGSTHVFANASCTGGATVVVEQGSAVLCQAASGTHAVFVPGNPEAFAGKCDDVPATPLEAAVTVCCLP